MSFDRLGDHRREQAGELFRLYRVLVNGQTGAVMGDKPADSVKVWLVVAAVAIVVLFLLLLLFTLLPRA